MDKSKLREEMLLCFKNRLSESESHLDTLENMLEDFPFNQAQRLALYNAFILFKKEIGEYEEKIALYSDIDM